MLKRLLGAEDGWGAALGLLLLLGFGLFILFISVADLREAARSTPEERTCEAWLRDPSGARWVTLTGCRLHLAEAVSRRWKGWLGLRDGGVSGAHHLELFVPLYVGDTPTERVSGVLATSSPALLGLLDGIDRLPPQEVEGYLQAHAAEFEAVLSPPKLTGYVEPVKSIAAVTALGYLTTDEAVVLQEGRGPRRANSIFGLFVGLLCVGAAVRSIGRRWLVDRDSTLG
ncbi:MAG: hypothetical protein ACOZQL_16930 [Myxococcota bacterium]